MAMHSSGAAGITWSIGGADLGSVWSLEAGLFPSVWEAQSPV